MLRRGERGRPARRVRLRAERARASQPCRVPSGYHQIAVAAGPRRPRCTGCSRQPRCTGRRRQRFAFEYEGGSGGPCGTGQWPTQVQWGAPALITASPSCSGTLGGGRRMRSSPRPYGTHRGAASFGPSTPCWATVMPSLRDAWGPGATARVPLLLSSVLGSAADQADSRSRSPALRVRTDGRRGHRPLQGPPQTQPQILSPLVPQSLARGVWLPLGLGRPRSFPPAAPGRYAFNFVRSTFRSCWLSIGFWNTPASPSSVKSTFTLRLSPTELSM